MLHLQQTLPELVDLHLELVVLEADVRLEVVHLALVHHIPEVVVSDVDLHELQESQPLRNLSLIILLREVFWHEASDAVDFGHLLAVLRDALELRRVLVAALQRLLLVLLGAERLQAAVQDVAELVSVRS